MHACLPACRLPGPPTITGVSLGAQRAVVVDVAPPTDDGDSVVVSYRVVGVPSRGGTNITVSGFGAAIAGGKVSREGCGGRGGCVSSQPCLPTLAGR